MPLTPADKKWIERMTRRVLAEVIAQEAQLGGYDGATSIEDDGWAEEGKKRPRRIGF